MKKTALIFATPCLLLSCGIKGPPLPPLENKYEKLNSAFGESTAPSAPGAMAETKTASSDKTKSEVKNPK